MKKYIVCVSLKLALILLYLNTPLDGEEFPTALTSKDLDDFNNDEAHKDLEVFHPTNNWKAVKPGQAVPAGCHIRFNLQTGQNEAKLAEEEGLKQQMINKETSMFMAEDIKKALKKFKGFKDFSEKDQVKKSQRAQFRSMDELKKDMAALDIQVETDVQIITKLLYQLNNTNSTVDQKVTALLDLEYLVHQGCGRSGGTGEHLTQCKNILDRAPILRRALTLSQINFPFLWPEKTLYEQAEGNSAYLKVRTRRYQSQE